MVRLKDFYEANAVVYKRIRNGFSSKNRNMLDNYVEEIESSLNELSQAFVDDDQMRKSRKLKPGMWETVLNSIDAMEKFNHILPDIIDTEISNKTDLLMGDTK